MYNGLKEKYPSITYISTVLDERGNNMKLPPGTMWDDHHYEEPKYFINRFHQWDNWTRTHPGVGVLLGEYSVYQVDTPSGKIDWDREHSTVHIKYPRLLSAIAEGVYALGGERNPKAVWMSSYAPSLQRKESASWTPNMIYFDSQEVVLSPSYWQQWLFARYRGDHRVSVTSRGNFNPLYWDATIESSSGDVFLKVRYPPTSHIFANNTLGNQRRSGDCPIVCSVGFEIHYCDGNNPYVKQYPRRQRL
jgi:alpha-L-arabinofuranosidase